jgi:hypothetical protein
MDTRDTREQDPIELADQLERDARRLEHRADELGEEIGQARQDRKRKRDDRNIDGAPPEPEGAADAEAPPS